MDKAERLLQVEPDPVPVSTALKRAKENARELVKDKKKVAPAEAKKPFMSNLDGIGKAFRGGSKSLFHH